MPEFRVLDGAVRFDREVKLRHGGIEDSDHEPVEIEAPVYSEAFEYRNNTYVRLHSPPVNFRAHNFQIERVGNILEFGWVNLITSSVRQWLYADGSIVKECVANLPTWDTSGTAPWYQGVYWSTARAIDDREKAEEGEEVEGVFFNDQPSAAPYDDLYEHNGVPLGRLNLYDPRRAGGELKVITGSDRYIACLAFKGSNNRWEVPWHIFWGVDYIAAITERLGQPLTVSIPTYSRTRACMHGVYLPSHLLPQLLGKDGSEASKHYELLREPEHPYGSKGHGPIM
jgi:hypothetical protein